MTEMTQMTSEVLEAVGEVDSTHPVALYAEVEEKSSFYTGLESRLIGCTHFFWGELSVCAPPYVDGQAAAPTISANSCGW